MANIELVIKISEEDYDTLINHNDDRLSATKARINLWESLKNATVIPEGHGNLIDVNTLEFRNVTVLYGYNWEYGENTYADEEVVYADDIWNALPIIEADKESEE